MAKIRVLPDSLINMIAAGEIVERPASVVKELVENSLDAHAERIDVEITAGGKAMMTVRDDGEGMNRDDALLAFEHHATSKISSADDLDRIRTLGFRGEALPSVASVSRLSLKTVEKGSDEGAAALGTHIEFHGGVLKAVRELPWARGTEIVVRDLFYNIPARRKFLKTDATESSHVARLVNHYALANPAVYFSLVSNGRRVIDAPPVKTMTERVHQLFGARFVERSISVDAGDGDLRIRGLVSHPHQQRSSTDGQYFFINGRMVRDRVLTGALNQAYRSIIPSGTFPSAILFVDIPAGEIDVNVHPAKTEIRFRHAWPVQSFFRRAIEDALRGSRSFAHFTPPALRPGADEAAGTAGESAFRPVPADDADPYRDRVRQRVEQFYVRAGDGPSPVEGRQSTFDWGPRVNRPAAAPGSESRSDQTEPPVGGDSGWNVLGQWRDSFIVAGGPDELMVIDQHVAHERVLYEQYLRQMAQGEVVRQKLLVPQTIELNSAQMMMVRRLMERLAENGFEIEQFGERSIVVKAVPALARECEIQLLVHDILERVEDLPEGFSLDEIRKRVAAGLACRAAVKINTRLSREKMELLLDQLRQTEDPTTCPHGRPVVLRIHIRDLEKNFKRI